MRVAIFAFVFGVFAEVWFRTVMPAAQTPGKYQHDPATVYRHDPFGPRTGRYTVGRLCLRGGEWHINSAGWNSGAAYSSAAERKRPLIALFGDSSIEGFLTDTDQHIDAYLPRLLPGTDCYAFGVGGWYLEQYAAVSRYASARFQPDVLVVFVDSSDVSDSLRTNGMTLPNWWQIVPRGTSFAELPPTSVYDETRQSQVARKSALIRYLRYNAKLALPGMPAARTQQTAVARGAPGKGDAATAATLQASTADAWKKLLPAARFMVDRLCSQNPSTSVVFVARGDSARYLSLRDVGRTPLPPDCVAVEAACGGRAQCSFIDLRYAFSSDWAAHHIRFEASDGAHWNAYANRLVAQTLADFIRHEDLLP